MLVIQSKPLCFSFETVGSHVLEALERVMRLVFPLRFSNNVLSCHISTLLWCFDLETVSLEAMKAPAVRFCACSSRTVLNRGASFDSTAVI
jgi:hypothetical protein